MAWRPLSRRTIIFILVGLIAYLIGLFALIPARAGIDDSDKLRVGGTIWNGEAVYASALRIEWNWSPLDTFTHLGFTANWRLSGGGTDLTGRVTKSGGTYHLSRVSGQVDGSLLDLVDKGPSLRCRVVADVAMESIVLGGIVRGAKGRFHTSPASCSLAGSTSPPGAVPAMQGEIAPGRVDSSGALSTQIMRQPIVELRLTRDGTVSIWATGRAVQVAPILAGWRYETKID